MYVIGLTGNIATGKSTVAAMLRRLGACVIDADDLVHDLLRAGTEVNRRVVARFGAEVRAPSGDIDRAKLGALAFADAKALADLEGITHPAVVAESLRLIAACDRPVCVVEAIKLFEANMHRTCQAVWVVTSSREQQVERLMRTRGLSAAQAEFRMDAQPPASAKVARADVVIDNTQGLAETWAQVVRAWNAIPGLTPVPLTTSWAGPEGALP
jgi:dephospho-CoA kinase